MIKHYLLSIVMFCLASVWLTGCAPSEPEQAVAKIAEAKSLLVKGDTLTALQHLDSVKTLYPAATVELRNAQQLSNRVYVSMIMDIRQELDSVKRSIALFSKNFTTEKGAFDRTMHYVPKRQTFKRSWDRSFIEVHLNEKGDLYLSSNYYGDKWLNHTGLRVYDGDLQAKTGKIELGDPNNHHSDFMDKKWEKVTYRDGKSDDVIACIANHKERKLKAVFLGKRHHYIVLESFDKEAVADALTLSKVLKRKIILEKRIKLLQKKIVTVN